jgi:hypothetical protein
MVFLFAPVKFQHRFVTGGCVINNGYDIPQLAFPIKRTALTVPPLYFLLDHQKNRFDRCVIYTCVHFVTQTPLYFFVGSFSAAIALWSIDT